MVGYYGDDCHGDGDHGDRGGFSIGDNHENNNNKDSVGVIIMVIMTMVLAVVTTGISIVIALFLITMLVMTYVGDHSRASTNNLHTASFIVGRTG